MHKISVILTSYNHGQYIGEAIKSVLDQSYTDFQLIIWDDASSDDSWEIIKSFSDKRIIPYRNKQNMRGGNINRALDFATGEYIAIHHSDDVWELDKLQKQAAYLDAHAEVGAVFTWAQIIDENGVNIANNWFDEENKTRWQWLGQLFNGENHLNHPSVLIRKKCYEAVGHYRYGLAQTADAEMWSRVLMKFPIHVVQEKLTKHRLFSDKSNSSGLSPKVEIRLNNEWNIIRENYLSMSDFEDIVTIFPHLERFRNSNGFDIKFLLAMACLYECKQGNAWQLGIKWLYDFLNDEALSKKIRELYSFSYIDFIKLTGEFDTLDFLPFQELKNTNLTLHTQVHDLLTTKAWLEEQRLTLENLVNERDQSILTLQAEVQDLLIAKEWLDGQRQAWEKLAAEREQSILSQQVQIQDLRITTAWVEQQKQSLENLATHLRETTERLETSNATLDKIRNHWGDTIC